MIIDIQCNKYIMRMVAYEKIEIKEREVKDYFIKDLKMT